MRGYLCLYYLVNCSRYGFCGSFLVYNSMFYSSLRIDNPDNPTLRFIENLVGYEFDSENI